MIEGFLFSLHMNTESTTLFSFNGYLLKNQEHLTLPLTSLQIMLVNIQITARSRLDSLQYENQLAII